MSTSTSTSNSKTSCRCAASSLAVALFSVGPHVLVVDNFFLLFFSSVMIIYGFCGCISFVHLKRKKKHAEKHERI